MGEIGVCVPDPCPSQTLSIEEGFGKENLANGRGHERGSARTGRKGSTGSGLSGSTDKSRTSPSEVNARGGIRAADFECRWRKGRSELSLGKRSSSTLSLSISREGAKRNKVMHSCEYYQLEKQLENAKRRMQVICAENDSLRKRLGFAERRIHDLEGKLETNKSKQDMMGELEMAKNIIRNSLKNGDIKKHDVLLGKEVEPSKRKGMRRNLFILALSVIREELRAADNNKENEFEKKAVARHDSKRLELGKWDQKSDPHDLLDKIDRELLAHITIVVEKCERTHSEAVEVKPTYICVKRMISQGKENLMRCQRNTIRELIGKPAKRKYVLQGPKASEIRTLLMNRYMAEEAPHVHFETEAMDESMGNDVKTVVRMVAALHVLGLPGGLVGEIKEAAQRYHEFADYVANSDCNVQAPIIAKELKRIVDTRQDSQLTLIYLKKLLPEIVAIGYQPRTLRDRNRCTDIVVCHGNQSWEEPHQTPLEFPLLGWK